MGKTRKVLIAFLMSSMLLLITGTIMLTIGLIKFSEDRTCMTSEPIEDDDSALFTSSHVKDIPWSSSLTNPDSPEFKKVAEQLAEKIHHALEEGKKRKRQFLRLVREVPDKRKRDEETPADIVPEKKPRVIVNKIEKAPDGGVYVYLTLIFPEGLKNQEQLNDLVNSLNKEGLKSNLFVDPLAQCEGQPKGPPEKDQSAIGTTTTYPMTTLPDTVSTICYTVTPSQWPVTTPSGGIPDGRPATKPLPEGVTCDVGGRKVASIFLIDVATPNVGTIDQKLANISNLLTLLPYSVHLPTDGSPWSDGVTFQIVTYVNGEANELGEPCGDSVCWQNMISQLNSSSKVNPKNSASHNLATGMEYLVNRIMPNIPESQARSVIIILDSIDVASDHKMASMSDSLRNSYYCVVSALQIGHADSVKARLNEAISDSTHYYVIPSFEWILNPTVVTEIDHWICDARLPTPPSQPTTPTTPSLITTPSIPTISPISPYPVIDVRSCALDVLFLVDESQSMMDYGFHESMDMVRKMTDQFWKTHNNSRFALVTFNSALVFSTFKYLPKATFYEAIHDVTETTGATYFELGFDAARSIIKGTTSRHSNEDVRSLILFFTDGMNGNGTVEKVLNISKDLRTNLDTQIVAIGLNATTDGEALTREVIGVGLMDAVQSSYFNMKEGEEKEIQIAQTIKYATKTVHCKNEDICGVDLTFVIEVSESELAENVDVQKAAVAATIHHFRQNLGPFNARVSLVFFSAPQGLQLSEYERSGILYSQVDDPILAMNLTLRRKYILGGASDLKLAMQLTKKVLDENDSGNNHLIIVMARGEYQDGGAINCCDDPSEAAKAVKDKGAKMQGVVIGGFPNKPLLDKLTDSNSIDGNALVTASDPISSGKRIAAELIPIIEERQRDAVCAVVPSFVLPCQEIVDLIIAIHASTSSSFNTTKYFISRELLPDIFGGRITGLPLSNSVPVNIAIIVYSTLGSSTAVRLTDHASPSHLTHFIEKLEFTGPGKGKASKAFEEAKRELEKAREGASTVLLMFSDSIENGDLDKAISFKERELKGLSYSFGVFVTTEKTQREKIQRLVDHGMILSTIEQLNLRARRSARNYANQITRAVCRYVGPELFNTPSPSPPRIVPPPRRQTRSSSRHLRPREVWPDVVVLIDSAVNFTHREHGTDDNKMDKFSSFLSDSLFPKFVIDANHTRVTIATFNSELRIICKYTDISSFSDLEKCLRQRLIMPQFKSDARDLASSLADIERELFDNPSSGFRPLKENILLTFLNGRPTESREAMSSVFRRGLRTLTVTVDTDVEQESIDGHIIKIKKLEDLNPDVAEEITDNITLKRPLPLSRIIASDFIFIIDGSINDDKTKRAGKMFMAHFLNHINVGELDNYMTVVTADGSLLMETTNTSQDIQSFLSQSNWKEGKHVESRNLRRPGRPSFAFIISRNKKHSPHSVIESLEKAKVSTFIIAFEDDEEDLLPKNNLYLLTSMTEKGEEESSRLFQDVEREHENILKRSVSLRDVCADFIVVVDVTEGKDNEMKEILYNLTSSLTISSQGAHIAILPFSNRLHIDYSIPLTGETKMILEAISNMAEIKKSSEKKPTVVMSALTEISQRFLNPSNSWRQGKTYIILLTTAKSIPSIDKDFIEVVRNLNESSTLISLSKSHQASSSLSRLMKTFTDNSFSTSSEGFKNLMNEVSQDYHNVLFPPSTVDISTDYLFLLPKDSEHFQKKQKLAVQTAAALNERRDRFAVAVYDEDGQCVHPPKLEEYNALSWYAKTANVGKEEKEGGKANLEKTLHNLVNIQDRIGMDQKRPLIMISLGDEEEPERIEGHLGSAPLLFLDNESNTRLRTMSSNSESSIERLQQEVNRYRRAWKNSFA